MIIIYDSSKVVGPLERLAMDERSSLFGLAVSDEEKTVL